ncbi:MAG TPA: hypothetical protein VM684_11895 [Gaiellales bacterium]|nr:hypothetical protein [Gaiellales bacterium]
MQGGAAGSGAQAASRNALQHGRCRSELIELRRSICELLRGTAETLELP